MPRNRVRKPVFSSVVSIFSVVHISVTSIIQSLVRVKLCPVSVLSLIIRLVRTGSTGNE